MPNKKHNEKTALLNAEKNDFHSARLKVRHYIKSELLSHFTVLELSAHKKGPTKSPESTISDIMMRDLADVTFTKPMEMSRSTKNIPVILLTTVPRDERLPTEHNPETPPFIMDVFVLQVNRKEAEKKCPETLPADRINTTLNIKNDADQKFMERIFRLVEQNIENPSITIGQLTREAGMSRTQLYKRIKAITRQTLFEFIYLIRLTKAAEILLHEKVSVTEVASRVGYSSLSVFTRSFTRLFNINPSKYAQRKQL